MAKYSKAAQKKVGSAMKKMEKGTLKSGGSGKKVTNKKQAIAIGLSEAKKSGAKVPAKKSVPAKIAASKKPVAKKATAPKPIAKKAAPKKAVAKKATSKKVVPKKATPKKVAAPTPAVKKAAPKKAMPQKPAPQKAVVKKAAPKKVPVKKTESKTTISNEENFAENLPDDHTTATEFPVEEINIVNAVKDPITMPDQNVYNKATSKMDPKHNMPVSSNKKGGIKPSGKKPLW